MLSCFTYCPVVLICIRIQPIRKVQGYWALLDRANCPVVRTPLLLPGALCALFSLAYSYLYHENLALSSKAKVEVNGINRVRPNLTSKGSNLLFFTIVCILVGLTLRKKNAQAKGGSNCCWVFTKDLDKNYHLECEITRTN